MLVFEWCAVPGRPGAAGAPRAAFGGQVTTEQNRGQAPQRHSWLCDNRENPSYSSLHFPSPNSNPIAGIA